MRRNVSYWQHGPSLDAARMLSREEDVLSLCVFFFRNGDIHKTIHYSDGLVRALGSCNADHTCLGMSGGEASGFVGNTSATFHLVHCDR